MILVSETRSIHSAKWWYIGVLEVKPAFRRRGLAHHLLRFVVLECAFAAALEEVRSDRDASLSRVAVRRSRRRHSC